jgi:hypothetical protein
MPLVVIEALVSIRIGSPSVGIPDRDRVGGEQGLQPAVRGDARLRGVGAGQQNHAALRGRTLEIRGEAADVMALADRNGGDSVRGHARQRLLDRSDHEPGSGQSSAVPAQGATAVGDDGRIAISGHAAGIERGKIGRGERQAVSGVAEQVALDQDLGDRV